MNLEKANGEVKICADSDQTKTCVLLLTFCVNNIKVFIFSFVFSLFFVYQTIFHNMSEVQLLLQLCL